MIFKCKAAPVAKQKYVVTINEKGARDSNGKPVCFCSFDQKEIGNRFKSETEAIKQWRTNDGVIKIKNIKVMVEPAGQGRKKAGLFYGARPIAHPGGSVILYSLGVELAGITFDLTDIYELANDENLVKKIQQKIPMMVGPMADNLNMTDYMGLDSFCGENPPFIGWDKGGQPSGWMLWGVGGKCLSVICAAHQVLQDFSTRIPTPIMDGERLIKTEGSLDILRAINVVYVASR